MNDENLLKKDDLTPSERRESARKAGKASARKRHEKREFRELLAIAFEMQMKRKDGTPIESPATGRPMSAKEASMVRLMQQCVEGDTKAIALAYDILGEKVVKQEITGSGGKDLVSTMTREEMIAETKRILKDLEE